MMNTSGMSPADLAAVIGNGENGWGNNGGWIWILLIFAIFGGWGNGSWGGNGVQENYVLASDFANLSRQIDSQTGELMRQTNQIGNGLCDGFYTNAQLINGTNMNLADGFARAELARANNMNTLLQTLNANNVTQLQDTNAIQNQISQCCCNNRYEALQNATATQNEIASGFCQTNFNNSNNTRDIIDAQNNGTQAILAKLSCMESNAKDERIANLVADNQTLKFMQSQIAQNNYLVNAIRPTPIPAYPTVNPWCTPTYNPYLYGTAIQ